MRDPLKESVSEILMKQIKSAIVNIKKTGKGTDS